MTNPTDTNDLIERLEALSGFIADRRQIALTTPASEVISEAAQAIRKLVEEREEARKLASNYKELSDGWKARAEDLRSLLDEAVGALEAFVSCDDDAKSNPCGGLSLGGLMDCRDNSGCVYTSQHLGESLDRSRALLSKVKDQAP